MLDIVDNKDKEISSLKQKVRNLQSQNKKLSGQVYNYQSEQKYIES